MSLDPYTHEWCNVVKVIYNLKQSIIQLEAINPRTPKVEALLKENKELEQRLREAIQNPQFIKNLTEARLKETIIKAKTFSSSQSKRREKRNRWKGKTAQERAIRNQEIITDWKKSKLTLNSFAERQAKKHDLSITQVKNIIKNIK